MAIYLDKGKSVDLLTARWQHNAGHTRYMCCMILIIYNCSDCVIITLF